VAGKAVFSARRRWSGLTASGGRRDHAHCCDRQNEPGPQWWASPNAGATSPTTGPSIADFLERCLDNVEIVNVADRCYSIGPTRPRTSRVFAIDRHSLPHVRGTLRVAELASNGKRSDDSGLIAEGSDTGGRRRAGWAGASRLSVSARRSLTV
jgi:hypothetical protein